MTRRLLVSYLTITVAVLALFEIPLAVIYQQRETDRIAADVERDAMVLATIYEDNLEEDTELDPDRADRYSAETKARVVVVDERGISRVDTDDDVPRDFSTRPEIDIALSGLRSTGTRRSDTLDTDLLYVAVPVASGGDVYGAVRLTLDTHEVTERVQRFWVALVAIGVVILMVMAAVGWLIARSVTRPVRRLQRVAGRFADGDLQPSEIDGAAPPELAALQEAMNVMAVRLDELLTRQREFVGDTSHQLRTPLTALRLRLENLETRVDDADANREIGEAIAETIRLSALVEDLLQLVRVEQPASIVDIDLVQVVRDRLDTWSATAEQHDVGLRMVSSVESLEASAVAGGIEQVLDNLIDNAIRMSPAHGVVTIEVSQVADRCRFAIRDEGPGLDDADKPVAFQRFWRADTSGVGTGLGLAIAHDIITASGGTLTLSDNDPTGLVITATVPAASRLVSATTDRRPMLD